MVAALAVYIRSLADVITTTKRAHDTHVRFVHQFGSWSMTTLYVAISLAMAGVTFGNRLVLKFVPRRNRRW